MYRVWQLYKPSNQNDCYRMKEWLCQLLAGIHLHSHSDTVRPNLCCYCPKEKDFAINTSKRHLLKNQQWERKHKHLAVNYGGATNALSPDMCSSIACAWSFLIYVHLIP